MGRRFLLCWAWLAAANLVQAQPTLPSVTSGPASTAPAAWSAHQEASACGVPLCNQEVCGPPGQIWVRGEYLLWWTKSNLLPPLLTTSPAGTSVETAGVLGQPGTSILFGDSGVSRNPRSGGRITLGTWLNQCHTFGVEANYFALESSSSSFNAGSNGNPILVRPFFNSDTGEQEGLLTAFPGVVAGSFNATVTSSTLYGGELLVRQNLCCGCCYRVDLLGGYRYLHLNEGLDLFDSEISTGENSGVPVGTRIDVSDRFHTRNNFNGGELGLEAEFRRCNLFVDVLGKVALGGTSSTVSIDGSTRIDPSTVAVPGGFLASASQLGRFHHNTFAVVPEAGLRVGYQVNDSLRVFAGYTFIYWSDVARPGDQVNLNVSRSHLPPAPAGPAQPLNIRTSDYWAQGVSFGLEFRY